MNVQNLTMLAMTDSGHPATSPEFYQHGSPRPRSGHLRTLGVPHPYNPMGYQGNLRGILNVWLFQC